MRSFFSNRVTEWPARASCWAQAIPAGFTPMVAPALVKPTAMEGTGFLGAHASVIHGIHVDARDVDLLADTETIVVACPTTEGNLGDGQLPALAYRDAGVRLAIGSDSQVRVDPFEETRELETGARREGTTRRALLAQYGDLWAELARNGLASLGLEANGTIDVDLEGVKASMGLTGDVERITHRELQRRRELIGRRMEEHRRKGR